MVAEAIVALTSPLTLMICAATWLIGALPRPSLPVMILVYFRGLPSVTVTPFMLLLSLITLCWLLLLIDEDEKRRLRLDLTRVLRPAELVPAPPPLSTTMRLFASEEPAFWWACGAPYDIWWYIWWCSSLEPRFG